MATKKTRLASCSLAALLLCSSPLVSAAVSIPDWMRQTASLPLPNYPADTNAVVLLDDTEKVVTGRNEYVEHHRRVVKILRQ